MLVINKSKEKLSWLETVTRVEHLRTWDWSVRQVVFHHHFDMRKGRILLVVVSIQMSRI